MNKDLGKTGIIIIIVAFIIMIGIAVAILAPKISSVEKKANNIINHEQSPKEKFESYARLYLNSSKSQFERDDSDKSYMCYYIDTSEYTGSVKVEKDEEGNIEVYIWLSNGTYYANGTLENLQVGENNKSAPTDCHRFG